MCVCVCETERQGESVGVRLDVSSVYLPKTFLSCDSDVLSAYRSGTEAEKDMVESLSSWLA